jgi:predicted ATP-grasp superfamily ATP-dependent carboligase
VASGAVVVGAHVNGLGVIRALAAQRVPTVAISTRSFDVAHHSRWVREHHQLFELHQRRESLAELLERNERHWRGFAVFPTNDDALTALAQHHDRLAGAYRLTVQPWETVADIVDKDRMHGLAKDAGLEVPVCHGPASAETAAKPLPYPVVVKPIQHDRLISSSGRKLFLARGPGELREAIGRLEASDLRGLVFEFVPGPDRNLYVYCVYLDARGEPSAGVAVQKLRQNPPLIGGARVAQIVPDVPDLREATVELLRRAGFRGMAFAEFKRDPGTGRLVFIEVNGRAVQFNSLLPPTGVDLVSMCWSDFVLGERPRARPTGWSGSWIHLQADIRCSLSYRRLEGLTAAEFVAPYRRPKTFAVWSASDPRPYLAQTALGMRGAIGALHDGGRARSGVTSRAH